VRFFALFAAAKSLGLRTVMMNESHAGTERATGWKKWIKRQIVRQFAAALVVGEVRDYRTTGPHDWWSNSCAAGSPAREIKTRSFSEGS
jgi:hypothetical protein